MLRSAPARGYSPPVSLEWQLDPECTCDACRIRRLAEAEITEINEFVFPFAQRAHETLWRATRLYSSTAQQKKIANHTLVAWRRLRDDMIADVLARQPRTEGCSTRRLVLVKGSR